MANVVNIVVRARDEASRIFLGLDRAIGGALSGIAGKITGAAGAFAKAIPMIAGVGSAAITAFPMIVSAGQAIASAGAVALAAAPGLIAMAVAGGVVMTAFKQIFAEGSAMREVLKPISTEFTEVGKRASEAAASGLKPLVEGFNRAVMPEVNHAFIQIGNSVNQVAAGFLHWAQTAQGVSSIKGILHPIWQALDNLEEPILRVGTSFLEMLGRIMGVSAEAGANGLATIFEKLAAAMDKVNADTVSGAFAKIKSAWDSTSGVVSKVIEVLGIAWRAYQTYQTQFSGLADVLAVVAIAFGGPVTALIAAVGLIIRHFDDLKTAYNAIVSFFTQNPIGTGFIDDLRTAADTVLPSLQRAFTAIGQAVIPVLKEIGDKIVNDLIPALGNFIAAAAPVVAWFVDTFGPMLARTFANILQIIKGAIDIIIGIFKVLTGILTGDWSQAWDGVVQILQGAWTIIKAIFDQLLNVITTGLGAAWDIFVAVCRTAIDAVLTLLGNLGSMIVGLFASAGSWLLGAGSAIINGLWSGIQTAWTAVVNFFTTIGTTVIGWFAAAASWLISAGNSIIQGLWEGIQAIWNSTIVQFFVTLPITILAWFAGALTWLLQSGRDIIQGLWDGAKAVWELVSAWFVEFTTVTIPGFFAGCISWLLQFGRDIITGLWDGLKAVWTEVASWFGTLKDLITGFFSDAASWLFEKGKDIIRGLIDGIKSMVGEVTGAVGDVIGAAKNAVTGAVGSVFSAIPGLARGGVVGGMQHAAAGKIGSGWTKVNERGPEMVRLPSGSHVYPSGTSGVKMRRMAGNGTDFGALIGELHINVSGGGNAEEIAEKVREEVEKVLAEVAERIRAGAGRR